MTHVPKTFTDSFGRIIRDLRISLTDRCNFRCLYCLPETEEAANFFRTRRSETATPIPYVWKPRVNLLTYEEIERVTRIAVAHGVEKIRLTGGEPLLRRDVPALVARLAAIDGLKDLALTTNGFHFVEQAEALRKAGLRRVTISLDSLERDNFTKLTGRDALDTVLKAIRLARDLGFHPLRVNAVIIRHLNDHEIESLAEFARAENIALRYIEFMPLDSRRAWQMEHVVPAREILARLQARHALEPVVADSKSATATRWRFADGRGEVGFIAPVSEPFCGHCNRLRLTADGKIRTCLFSLHEHDLKAQLRDGANAADDETVAAWLRGVILHKEARHHIGEEGFQQPDRPMSAIGG
ncbi:MAG: GTP 3',8-cyclase MoaA [Pedosphaera sp.]|nr:GTP 3',8-cyclase MoaA [Pedosphaera sp.]MSU42574.1 GTP 3',8-cyclase MoaA [Pedosphaera sp.]